MISVCLHFHFCVFRCFKINVVSIKCFNFILILLGVCYLDRHLETLCRFFGLRGVFWGWAIRICGQISVWGGHFVGIWKPDFRFGVWDPMIFIQDGGVPSKWNRDSKSVIRFIFQSLPKAQNLNFHIFDQFCWQMPADSIELQTIVRYPTKNGQNKLQNFWRRPSDITCQKPKIVQKSNYRLLCMIINWSDL